MEGPRSHVRSITLFQKYVVWIKTSCFVGDNVLVNPGITPLLVRRYLWRQIEILYNTEFLQCVRKVAMHL
jgi:hypothetical protein